MEKNLRFSLVMPFINGDRRQYGGDEGYYYVFCHVFRGFEVSGCQGVEVLRFRGVEVSRFRGVEGSRFRGFEDSRFRGIGV